MSPYCLENATLLVQRSCSSSQWTTACRKWSLVTRCEAQCPNSTHYLVF